MRIDLYDERQRLDAEYDLLEAQVFTPGYGSSDAVPVHESRKCAETTRGDAEHWAISACRYMANHDGFTEFSIHIERDDDAVYPFTAYVNAIKYIDIDDGQDKED